MAFNITDLRANLQFGGARATQFEVQLTMPAGVTNAAAAARKLTFTCEAASMPASNLGVIPIAYFGRVAKYAGDRSFSEWPVTIINDEDFLVRDALENWSNMMNARLRNIRQTSTSSPDLYKTSATVIQYGRTGNILRRYTMQGLWPSQIREIELSWGAVDQIERFATVFEYDWFDVEGATVSGNQS